MTIGLPPRVVVIGDVMTDVIVRPEGPIIPGADRRASIATRPGGSAANQAAWLGHLGARPVLLARVGAADRDRQVALLLAHGVEPVLAADPDAPTGMIVAILSGDAERSFLTDRGANAHLCAADLPAATLDGAQHVHVSAYCLFDPGPRSAVLDFVAQATQRGLPVSVDAASASFLRDLGAAAFLDLTAWASLCFANQDEAAVLAGTPEPAAILEHLARRYDRVVLKQGAQGAFVADRGGVVHTPAADGPVLDTTGAGDAFLAGFLLAHIGHGDAAGCLRAGTRAAAVAVAGIGGRPPEWPFRSADERA